MKTKILLTLFLSLFCIDGLARITTVKPKLGPGQGEVVSPRTRGPGDVVISNPAFNKQPSLIPVENKGCNQSCAIAAQSLLSTEGVNALNRTNPSTRKAVLINQIPLVYETAFNYSTGKRPLNTGIEGVTGENSSSKKAMALDATEAIAKAFYKSNKDKWPVQAKNNFTNFVDTMVAGKLTEADKKRLEKVKTNCR